MTAEMAGWQIATALLYFTGEVTLAMRWWGERIRLQMVAGLERLRGRPAPGTGDAGDTVSPPTRVACSGGPGGEPPVVETVEASRSTPSPGGCDLPADPVTAARPNPVGAGLSRSAAPTGPTPAGVGATPPTPPALAGPNRGQP